jgi:predicted  nucleic acid-binding Zn-ribbon protein
MNDENLFGYAEELEETTDALRAEIEALEREVEYLEKQVTKLEDEVSDAESEIDSLEIRIDELEDQVQDHFSFMVHEVEMILERFGDVRIGSTEWLVKEKIRALAF